MAELFKMSKVYKHHKNQYRADIDGLRGIAVLAVIGFHAFPGLLQGGFVGVDVFFVISGVLITSIILEGLLNGNFEFLEFYVRRIRRIFPSLIVILFASALLGWFVLVAGEYRQIGKHIIGSAGFISNFIFYNESGYFDTIGETKPLIHLWSLGVEEQFYIFWPFLLWVSWKLKFNSIITICVLFTLSFICNIILINEDLVAAYYLPQARIWELLVGALLSYSSLMGRSSIRPVSVIKKYFVSILGLILIVGSIFFISKNLAFPGFWALIPTAGAAMIIYAGPEAYTNRVILSRRILVWFGLISFPLYLWHWLILSFLRIIGNQPLPQFSRVEKIVAIIVAIVLAWLTYKFIEKPIRNNKDEKRHTVGLLFITMFIIFASGALMFYEYFLPKNRDHVAMQMIEAVGDWNFSQGLQEKRHRDSVFYYLSGDFTSITAFVGDSHVEQYMPRIVKLYSGEKVGKNTAFFLTLGGCYPISGIYEDGKVCDRHRGDVADFIKKSNVNVIVVGGCWNCYYLYADTNGIEHSKPARNVALTELKMYLTELRKSKKVYFLLDNPSGEIFNPRSFIIGSRITGLQFSPMTSMVEISKRQLDLRKELIELARSVDVMIIDPIEYLCTLPDCVRKSADGRPIYKDSDHLRPFFVRDNASYLDITVFSKERLQER